MRFTYAGKRPNLVPTIMVAIGLALLVTHFALQIDWHWDQDACTFGPVSNARYRELLAEAKRKRRTQWPPLVRDDYKASVLLNARFDDLSRNLASVYERLAAMHAILRALGANYRRPASHSPDPYEKLPWGGYFSFYYQVDINRLGFFAPILRRGELIGGVYAPGRVAMKGNPTDPTRYERGAVSFTVHFPKLIDGPAYVPRLASGAICPPVPAPEQAKYFN